jgi:hypothetical protein
MSRRIGLENNFFTLPEIEARPSIPQSHHIDWALDAILYDVDGTWYALLIATGSFIAVLVNLYNNSRLPLMRQFFLVRNRINVYVYPTT